MHLLITALRSLVRSPRYALIAGSLIALGIGACTTVFSLFDSLLVRDRPGITQPAQVVDIGRAQRGRGFDNLAFPDYTDFRAGSKTLSDLAAYRFEPAAAAW